MIMNIYIDKSMCWCEHSIFHVQPPLGLPNMAPGEKNITWVIGWSFWLLLILTRATIWLMVLYVALFKQLN